MLYKSKKEEYKKVIELIGIALRGHSLRISPKILFFYLVCIAFLFATSPYFSKQKIIEPVLGNAIIVPKLKLPEEKKLVQKE